MSQPQSQSPEGAGCLSADPPPPRRPGFHTPIYARHHVLPRTVAPVAYDWVRLVFIRKGSAIFHSEFGERWLERGDLAVLGANTLCGSQSVDHLTVTTLYLDHDYVVDQVFWLCAGEMIDRLDASQFLADLYAEPTQILNLQSLADALLIPRLDELVNLCDQTTEPFFYRAQAILSEVMDAVMPHIQITSFRETSTQRYSPILGERTVRFPAPLREEARVAAGILRASLSKRWTLAELAREVHLSPAQLSRVFVEAHGGTPLAYLTVLRAERLAFLLRTTTMSVQQAAHEVGWSSRSYAARVFQQHVGVSPRRYQTIVKQRRADTRLPPER